MSRLTDKLDRKYLKVGAYVAATIVIAYALCMMLSFSGGFFEKLWSLIKAVLVPLVYGAVLSYLFLPVVRRIDERLAKTHLGKGDGKGAWGISVLLSAIIALAVIAAILAVLVVMVTRSLSGVSIEGIRALIEETQGDFDEFLVVIQQAISDMGFSTEWIKNVATGVVSGVSGFFSNALFAVIFCIYFLLDGEGIIRYGKRLVYALVGDRFNEQSDRIVSDADRVFSGYIRGQFVDAFLVGVLASVVFTLMGVPYGAVVGMLMGIGNLIPYVGTPTGVVSVVLVCLSQGAYKQMALGLLGIAIIGFVDGNIINPRLLSQSVDVHPMLVVAALIAGGAIGGIAGMLVAVPVAAFLKVQLDRWVERREGVCAEGDDLGA